LVGWGELKYNGFLEDREVSFSEKYNALAYFRSEER